MAKLKIFTFPDKVLSQRAEPIARVEASYFRIADDMLETMYDAPGVGLAANQVGLLERILVIDTDWEYDEPEEGEAGEFNEAGPSGPPLLRNKVPRIVINPKIILSEGTQLFKEGCLSVPEFSAEIKRFEKIKIEYQTIDGLLKTLSAEGFLAVAIQHEMDHLDGKLFIDRLSPLKRDVIRRKLHEERRDRDTEELQLLEEGLAKPSRKRQKKKGL